MRRPCMRGRYTGVCNLFVTLEVGENRKTSGTRRQWLLYISKRYDDMTLRYADFERDTETAREAESWLCISILLAIQPVIRDIHDITMACVRRLGDTASQSDY